MSIGDTLWRLALAAHKYAGMFVKDILRAKKASVRSAPLPEGSPEWRDVEEMTWEEVDLAAREGQPGFKTIRKLLTDGRFER
jgi:hypothetical protein